MSHTTKTVGDMVTVRVEDCSNGKVHLETHVITKINTRGIYCSDRLFSLKTGKEIRSISGAAMPSYTRKVL